MPPDAPIEQPQSRPAPLGASASDEPLAQKPLTEDLLVEEISIDGMCGVY